MLHHAPPKPAPFRDSTEPCRGFKPSKIRDAEFDPQGPLGIYCGRMKVEEIAEAVAKLPPDRLARFRRWFTAFEAGRADHAKELDFTATKPGRLAGRALAELKKRTKEP